MTEMGDRLNARASMTPAMGAAAMLREGRPIMGEYTFALYERQGGKLLWRKKLKNVVTTVGQNQLLAAALQGSSYSVTGPFMGLISSASFSAVAVGDTMTSHAGWLEAGGAHAPTYPGTRATIAFGAPSGGVITSSGSGGSFTFSGGGTVQGGFMTFGAGAVNTIDNTSGVLLSAAAFGTPQPVIADNVLTIGYSLTL